MSNKCPKCGAKLPVLSQAKLSELRREYRAIRL